MNENKTILTTTLSVFRFSVWDKTILTKREQTERGGETRRRKNLPSIEN